MQKSKKGKVNWRDILRGALFGSGGALLPFFTLLASGSFDGKVLITSAMSFAGTFGIYIVKHIGEGEK